MGVRVNQWKGAWWLFVHYKGQRKRKRVGSGPQGKKAAELAAVQIRARLASGDGSVLAPESPATLSPTFAAVAEEWLKKSGAPAERLGPPPSRRPMDAARPLAGPASTIRHPGATAPETPGRRGSRGGVVTTRLS